MGTVSELATAVEDDEVVFRLADTGHALERATVWLDLVRPPQWPAELAMAQVESGWELRVAVPDLDCLEYLFDVDGTLAPDPGNPDRVDGAFGPHSWLAMPGYEPPSWLGVEGRSDVRHPLTVGGIDLVVWEPEGHDGQALPLLLVHDGAEMEQYGRIVQYAAALPPMRVALLSPGDDRDARYAANPAYADALVSEVVPAVTAAFETLGKPVLVGQSLGGLAALHVGWLHPGAFAGLATQSGSFFTPVLDPQESGYAHFDRVVEFVASVHESTATPLDFPPVAMTCGTAEENLANNRLLQTHLLGLGAAVSWGEVRQGHTWMCWRDTLDPHLTELLRRVWG